MGRGSTKKDKTIYQEAREGLDLSRAAASELLEFISEDRLERIESEKSPIQPDEVLMMAEKYRKPELCNHYCSNECPIGVENVPHIEIKSLSNIVLEMVDSINQLQKRKDRLIEITVDGIITDEEIKDFADIQKNLEKIETTVEVLKLWVEKRIADGRINEETLKKYKESMN